MYFATVLISLLLSAVFAEQNFFEVPECYDVYCEEICRPPQKGSPPDSTGRPIIDTNLIEYLDEIKCYCYCGRKLDDECETDGDCEGGLYCAAWNVVNGPGRCKSVCERPTVDCSIYSHCEVVNDKPTCICNFYVCSKDLYKPICATGNLEFGNRCLFEERNCERGRQGLALLERQGHGTCAEVRARIGLGDAHEYIYS